MFIDIIYPLLWFLLIFFGLRYQKIFQLEGLSKWDLSIGFLIKSLVSLLFIYIFTYYYGIGNVDFDSYQYYVDGKILNNVFYESPLDYFKLLTGIGEDMQMAEKYLHYTGKWFYSYTFFLDDAKNVIRLSSIIHFFSQGSFVVQFLFFDLIAVIGILFCVKAISKLTQLTNQLVFYIILFFPSLLFWGSGLLKEPLLLLGIGLFLFSVFKNNQTLILRIITILISLIILVAFKPYVLISIILILIIYLIHKYFKIKLIFSFLLLCLVGISVLYLVPSIKHKVVNTISFKQHDFINTGSGGLFCIDSISGKEFNIAPQFQNKIKLEGKKIIIKDKIEIFEINRYKKNVISMVVDSTSNINLKLAIILIKSQSYIPITPIKTSLNQLILNIPEALINSLFRPWFGDPGKEFKYFAMIETFLIFTFLILAIKRRRSLSDLEKILVFSLIILILSLSIIIGWTTPILGAIVRYRIPVYLAILLISFIIIEPPKRWKKENIS